MKYWNEAIKNYMIIDALKPLKEPSLSNVCPSRLTKSKE